MKQEIGLGFSWLQGDPDSPLRVWVRRERRQPARIDACFVLDGQGLASQKIGHERLGCLRIAEAPTGRWLVQRQAEPALARRGDGRSTVQRRRDPPGKRVGAVMAAKQRNYRAAALRHGDHRRFLALVGQERRQRADEHASRAKSDDRPSGGEQRSKMGGRIGERHRAAGDAWREAVQLSIDGVGDALACGKRGRSENDHGRTSHPTPRTRTMEK